MSQVDWIRVLFRPYSEYSNYHLIRLLCISKAFFQFKTRQVHLVEFNWNAAVPTKAFFWLIRPNQAEFGLYYKRLANFFNYLILLTLFRLFCAHASFFGLNQWPFLQVSVFFSIGLTYFGLHLHSPFMKGASKMGCSIDTFKAEIICFNIFPINVWIPWELWFTSNLK